MSGVLHPVGPEPAQTYWARRGLVFAAATVFAVALTLIISGTSSSSVAAPGPASAGPTYAAPLSPSALENTVSTPSLAEVSASATPSAKKTPKLKASPRKSSQSTPDSCAAKDLRPTLTGKQHIAPERSTTFQLSLINGSEKTCTATVTRKNFELKISSGSHQIWSTADCPTMIKAISHKLGSEHAVAWSLTWDGKRSKPTCKSASPALRSGRYVATAQLDGAAPVKLRMILNEGR
jgi:hypothetical protein